MTTTPAHWANTTPAAPAVPWSVSPADLEALSADAPRWLVDGLLPAASVVTLAGTPGLGKSFCALSWAAHVATGSDWYDLAVEGPASAVYVLGEGWRSFGRRVGAWRETYGELPETLRFVDGQAHGIDITDPEKVGSLIENLRVWSPALVVLDTFSMLAGIQSENDNAEVARAYRQAHRIVAEIGCTVVLVHHVAKASGQVRGAGAIRGNSDCVIVAKQSTNEGEGFMLSTEGIDDGKQRDGEGRRLHGFSVVPPGVLGRSDQLGAKEERADALAALGMALARGEQPAEQGGVGGSQTP